jgi:hypothetical protein
LDVGDDGDGSIYNGDENHKVWNGSQDQLDGIGMEGPYDIYSGGTSTLGRTPRQRQRQISAPIPAPPPPKEELKKKKDKKPRQSAGSQSLSGTLIRPRPMHVNPLGRLPPPHHPGMMIYGPLGGGMQQGRQFHTIGHRSQGHGHGGHHQGGGPPMIGMPMQIQMPMQMMVPQQYATLQNSRTNKKKKKDKMNGIPIGMPVPPPIFAPYPPAASMIEPPRPLSVSNRKLAQSAAGGLDESGSGADSPTGTGIYRRKGHLNERAFSYSIRQEHRSRSHGSLASLQFNPPDLKKEREIAQMVAGLELNEADQATLNRRGQMVMQNGGPPMMNGNGGGDRGGGSNGTFGRVRR